MKSASIFLESWTRGEQSPQSSPFPSFVLPCLLQPLHPVKNLQLPCRIRSEGQLGMLREQGLQPNLQLLGLSLSSLEPQTGLCYLCRSSVGCKTRSCGVCLVWVLFCFLLRGYSQGCHDCSRARVLKTKNRAVFTFACFHVLMSLSSMLFVTVHDPFQPLTYQFRPCSFACASKRHGGCSQRCQPGF